MTKLEAIAARHAARTPGVWVWDDSGLWAEDDSGGAATQVLFNDYQFAVTGTPDLTMPNYHDTEFIEQAGPDVASLLAAIEAMTPKGATPLWGHVVHCSTQDCAACELVRPE